MNLEIRLKKNKLVDLAGSSFVDQDSDLIKSLRREGKNALLGIKRSDGIYTVLGENSIYYKSISHNEGEIDYNKALNIFQENALRVGKRGDFNIIKLDDTNSIWVSNGPTMSALWNTILYIYKAV